MGLVTAPFELSNPRDTSIPSIRVDALVDTGVMTLCLPAALAEALQLEELERREVTLIDGGRHLVPYVGPLKVGGFGQRVLVGAILLEDMDLVVNPATRQVTVNPASPDIPSAIVMHMDGIARPQSFMTSGPFSV